MLLLQVNRNFITMLSRNVVRGFSLVLHDPKGSHYKNNKRSCGSLDPQGEAKASPLQNLELNNSRDSQGKSESKARVKLDSPITNLIGL
jgi:hypothetical protein